MYFLNSIRHIKEIKVPSTVAKVIMGIMGISTDIKMKKEKNLWIATEDIQEELLQMAKEISKRIIIAPVEMGTLHIPLKMKKKL